MLWIATKHLSAFSPLEKQSIKTTKKKVVYSDGPIVFAEQVMSI